MTKSTVIKSNNHSTLLHPSIATKTGLQISELPKEQSVILEKKFNEHLQGEFSRILDASISALPAKKDDITSIFRDVEKFKSF